MVSNNQKRQLIQAIDDHQAELLKLLNRLVSFQTVSPPARNTIPLQEFIAGRLNEWGFTTHPQKFYQQDMLLSAQKPGTADSAYHDVILNGHVDVAALRNRELWQSDPFEVVKKGDRVIGRGVSDMKGGMASFLYVFELMQQLHIALPGTIKFQSVVGEELGEAGTKTLLKQGEKADFAICGDSSACQLWGQGGVITGWITLQSKHTYHDGNRAAMVHAGGGIKAASMVEKMPVIIRALEKLEQYWGITKHYPGFKPGTDTINPAYIEGGIHPAFVADKCRLWITVHFYPNEAVDQVVHEVEDSVTAAAKADPWLRDNLPTFEWGGDSMLVDKGEVFPSLELDSDLPAMKLLQKEHQVAFKQPPRLGMSPSVCDGGWFDYYHIPAVTYGPGDLIQNHSDNESASFSELVKYSRTIATFLIDWCSTKR